MRKLLLGTALLIGLTALVASNARAESPPINAGKDTIVYLLMVLTYEDMITDKLGRAQWDNFAEAYRPIYIKCHTNTRWQGNGEHYARFYGACAKREWESIAKNGSPTADVAKDIEMTVDNFRNYDSPNTEDKYWRKELVEYTEELWND